MAKIYDRCPDSVRDRLQALIARYHPDLLIAEVSFDLMFVARDDEEDSSKPVLTLHGVPALAIVRIVSTRDRAKGCADVEIVIDRDRFNDCGERRQDAILDHELTHVVVLKEKDGIGIQTDDQHRPRLKLKPHDYDFGWFEAIARRYGSDAVEVQQARRLWDEHGQAFFPFAFRPADTAA